MERDLAAQAEELSEFVKALNASVNEQVAHLERKNRRTLVGNYVLGFLLVAAVGLGAWFFVDDGNDDRREADREEAEEREECALSNEFRGGVRDSLMIFTDALVAAAEDADPARVEAFRRDLQARLAEAVPDRLCDAEAEARQIGHRLSVDQFERLYR